MDLKFADSVCSLHLEGDHDRGDDFVGALGGLLHVAGDNVNRVPSTTLDLISRIHFFLDEPAGVESLGIRVQEVDRRDGIIVIQLDVGAEDFVGFLLKRQELLRGEDGGVGAGGEVRVAPWRAVGVTVAIVLVFKEVLSCGSIRFDLYTFDKNSS